MPSRDSQHVFAFAVSFCYCVIPAATDMLGMLGSLCKPWHKMALLYRGAGGNENEGLGREYLLLPLVLLTLGHQGKRMR